jgi:very-short-patch-repair endonuclease
VISEGEAALALHIRALKLPKPERQYRFTEALARDKKARKHAFDFCWPDRMLAVEVDGGVHRIKERFRADIERHNLAQILGWRVLRFSPADIKAGKAIDALERLFAGDADGALTATQRR